nr:hypothetical protein [Tanacetum cinerariifolium]
MSMMGEMTFFLSLQVNQSPCGIFINQYNVLEILKKYGMESCDPIGTPMEIKDKLDLDQNGTPVDAMKYRSMIGALMYLTSSRPDNTFKITFGGAQFLGEKLVSWSSKKQDCMAMSTAEAEYVSLFSCCAQVLWMRTQLTDYGFHFNKIPIYCDSKSAIAISCNPVQHSRTKHIAVCYHFIKEHVEKGTMKLYFVKTDYQLADLFTKALPADRFNYLISTDFVPTTPHDLPLSGGEDASKQGRNDDKIEEHNLTDEADTEVIVEDKGSGEKGGSTADQVSTARPETLIKLMSEKEKVKGVAFRDVKEPPRLTRSTTTLQPLPTIDPKDKARIDANHDLAIRMTHEEQEKYTIEERARLLAEYFERRKKQLAAERADKLYQKEQKWINDVVPMDSKKEEKKSVEPESKGKKGKRIKRVADATLKQKSSKKQKMIQEPTKSDEEESTDYEHEKEELRMWLTIVSDKEETVDPKILSTKYPIVDWESHNLGNVDMKDLHVYKIIRANRNISYHKSLSSMLRKFDRQDLVDLHRLVMKRFEDNTLEGYNLLLWGDLKKLEAEAESTMAFELLKFIKSQVEERDVWIHPPSDQDANNEET